MFDSEIEELNKKVASSNFWRHKEKAKSILKRLEILKRQGGLLDFDENKIIFHIYAGAGGLDAEDFTKMIATMYLKYANLTNYDYEEINSATGQKDGLKDICFSLTGINVYQKLKKERGILRLIRKSPFNSRGARHTSFCTIETIPVLKRDIDSIDEGQFKFVFSKSQGPGGQNVNKRETSVKVIDLKTNLSASANSFRTQGENRQKAILLLKSKIYQKNIEEKQKIEYNFNIQESDNWGQQRMTFIFHPAKLVKNHLTAKESNNLDAILNGEINLI